MHPLVRPVVGPLVRRVTDPSLSWSPPAPSDPLAEYVVSLLHLDGANNSTTFTDEQGHTWAIDSGSPVISTTESKFGGASLRVPATTARIKSPVGLSYSTDLASNGSFCIECWFNLDAITASSQTIIGLGGSGVIATLSVASNGKLYASASNSREGPSITPGQWYHVALSRDTQAARLFVNGVQQGATFTSFGSSVENLKFWANYDGSVAGMAGGYIDEMRFTKGHARYTENFDVPTAPFPG